MKEKLFTILKRFSIRNTAMKNFVLFVAILMIITVVITSMYNYNMKEVLKKELMQIAENDVTNMTEVLDRGFGEIDQISKYLLTDEDVLTYMVTGSTEGVTMDIFNSMKKRINSYRFVYDYIDSIYIYSEEKNMIFSTSGSSEFNQHNGAGWYEQYRNSGSFSIEENTAAGGYPFYLTFIRKSEENNIKGGVIINVDISELSSFIGDTNSKHQNKYIIDKEGDLVYKKNLTSLKDRIDNYVDYNNNDKTRIITKDDVLISIAVSESERYDFKYIVENELYDYQNRLNSVRNYTYLIMGILLVMSFVGASLFSFVTYKPLKNLIKLVDMGKADKSDINFGSSEEKYIAEKILMEMTRNEELKNELLNRMADNEQLKTTALRLQINPHFISNTLNLVHLKLLESVDINYAGNEILRNCSLLVMYVTRNSNDIVPIKDEVQYMRLFIQILYERSNRKTNFTVEIDEKLPENAQMLKLAMNTMIENAFYHGIAAKREQQGNVAIKIYRQKENLICSVEDDGVGMREEELKMLRERIENGDPFKGKNIGLVNVHNRVKLIFGEEYGLMVESSEGKGTKVTLTMPLIDIEDQQPEEVDK